ncbi:uncharacterized protein [Panulirus ornatus]|uniref:uncharacterized protein n=1 Tax=Panulirus ornatus TaxID=150431 RepID=UPI003A83FA66
MRLVMLLRYFNVRMTMARVMCRGLASFEFWLTTWLCVMFLAHLAITNTRLGHNQHHKGQVEFTFLPSPNTTNASSLCSAKCFRQRLVAPLLWNTARVVRHIRSLIQYPPHQQPYAHAPQPQTYKPPWNHASLKLEQDLLRIMGARKGGVYVVVGAGGQQWQYMARHLEGRGWRGLMVEANAHNLAQQQAAHARAALLCACVTYEPLLLTRRLWRPFGADLPGVGAMIKQAQEEHVMLEEYVPAQEKALGVTHEMTCYPLETVVLALRAPTVDLLVLDSPGLADDLLQSLNRKRFKVKVVAVRVQRLEDGQDETRYTQMSEELGLLQLAWYGSYVVLAHPSANLHVRVVRS